METMQVENARFTGAPYARCSTCQWTIHYWDTPADWGHECRDIDGDDIEGGQR